MDYEWGYLRAFMESKDSILIVAMDGGEVVGASTGLPMETETENVKGPLANLGEGIGDVVGKVPIFAV